MSVITLASGTRFSAERGVTLLDAALAQGVVLEHSCRTGRCGTRKARVVHGEVAALRDASALPAADTEAGWVLTCAHEACSDLELDIEDLGASAGIALKTVPSRIDALELLAPDVLRVELRLPPTAGFRFLAGQSIDVTSPGGVRRSYSLSSDAAAPGRLELQVELRLAESVVAEPALLDTPHPGCRRGSFSPMRLSVPTEPTER
jgi:CDP-4-dehydro-6-deoxyglucose reductase